MATTDYEKENKILLGQLNYYKNQARLLATIDDGCKKHPGFKARRRVKTNCKICINMMEARRELTGGRTKV